MAFIAPLVGAVVSAVGAVGSFVAGLGFVGQALVGIGVSVAAGYIQKATGKAQKQPGGVQFERQYGGSVGRQVACGLVGVAGQDAYVNTHGPSNALLQQVYVLSDFPCHALSRVALNGKWVNLGAPNETGRRTVLNGEFANRAFVWFVDGTQSTAHANLVAQANPSGRWTAAHVGSGICYAIIGLVFQNDGNNSFPDVFFEVQGARLYDWRKDSTAGGSGAHRWGNYATYEFTENPVVIEYNYRRGLAWGGDAFCGMGMPAGDLPFDKWTAAANLCDEATTYGPRYRCSILLDCTATHGENIEALQLACGAKTIDAVDGSWPLVGHDQATVATITDDDLITSAPARWSARRSMGDLVNAVSGSFADSDQLWSMIGYEPATSSALVTLDRRTRDIAIDFPMVRSKDQAAQLAGIYLEENRYEASGDLVLRPRWQVLEAGDWIAWNSARFGNRTYQVTSVSLASLDADGPRNASVGLQEVSGAIYDGITAPPITAPWPPGEPELLNEVQSFSVLPITVGAPDGRVLPAIRAAWETIEDVTVTHVDIRYHPVAQPTSVITKRVPVDQIVTVLVEGVVGQTQYRVMTRLVTDPPRPVAWSAGGLVTTLDIGTDLQDFSNGLRDLIEREFGEQLAATRLISDQLALLLAEQDAGNYTEMQRIVTEMRQTAGRIKAAYTREIVLATGPDSALAQSIELLYAVIDDVEASIDTKITAAVGPDSAIATAITSLQAAVGALQAGVTVRWVASASLPGGAIAGWDFQAKVGDDVFTALAAMHAYAFGSPGSYRSEMWFEADRIAFGKSGTAGFVPLFVISGGNIYLRAEVFADSSITVQKLIAGTLSAISGNLGTITAGRMLSPDGRVDFNLSAGYLYFSGA